MAIGIATGLFLSLTLYVDHLDANCPRHNRSIDRLFLNTPTQTPCLMTKIFWTLKITKRKLSRNSNNTGRSNRVKILKMHTRWRGMVFHGVEATTTIVETILEIMQANFGEIMLKNKRVRRK
jgi:hypothetical protein